MQTVACFGDSLIYGFPFGPRISWLAEAEKLTGDKFLNYGVCGDCTDDILSRLKTMPLPAHIKHILFLGGANDIIQMRPQKFILEDLDKTLRYCQSKNFDLGIVLPLVTAESRLNEYILPLRDVNKRTFCRADIAAGSAACCWTDCCRTEGCLSGWRTPDGSRLQGDGNICCSAA